MSRCKAEMIAAGAETVPRTCPVHGIFKCPEAATERQTINEHDVYGYVVLGISDKLGARPDVHSKLVKEGEARTRAEVARELDPGRRYWVAAVVKVD